MNTFVRKMLIYVIVIVVATFSIITAVRNKKDVGKLCETMIASQKYKDAINNCDQAAQRKNNKAQYYMGWMYDSGRGTAQDYKKAMEWYQKAAINGSIDAQYNLGVMYALSKGTDQNSVMALAWYLVAANGKHSEATKAIASVSTMMTAEQINEAQALANKMLGK